MSTIGLGLTPRITKILNIIIETVTFETLYDLLKTLINS